MLVTFKCKGFSNITMFGDVAKNLLKIMGQSGNVPGAILANDVPAVLERLKNSIQESTTKKAFSSATKSTGDPDGEEVSLAHRALPLIELLTVAAKEQCDVMWSEGDNLP
jgi:hypothetical protein